MKNTVTTLLCILCAAVLAGGAMCIGAYRGWSGERNEVLDLIGQNGELAQELGNRAMDAANLAVVAARHLPADSEELRALTACRDVLMASSDASALAQADDQLTLMAATLRETLLALPSVQESRRDQVYVSTLTRALADGTSLSQTYAGKAEDFNQRLNSSPTGWLAKLLGVEPIALN